VSVERERKAEAEKIEKVAKAAKGEFEKRETLKVKALSEVLGEAGQVRYVDVPELDCRIAYKKLPMKDFNEIKDEKDPTVLSLKMLYRMLHAADSSVTMDMVEQMPFDIATAIITRIMGETPLATPRALQPSPGAT